MKQRITIKYNGDIDNDLDTRLAGLLEHIKPPFGWIGQGYDINKNERDISFEREIK